MCVRLHASLVGSLKESWLPGSGNHLFVEEMRHPKSGWLEAESKETDDSLLRLRHIRSAAAP